ncbi:hypothetical protein ABZ027_40840 [Streptomyces sp. NPDC006332]|uniref:hypothetical protein n=1 Tax=Streptomyces sp. NPDC006332 TaxID=3155456 RepID=UPI0033AB8402
MRMWDEDGSPADFAGLTVDDWLNSGEGDCGCCRTLPAAVPTADLPTRCDSVRATMEWARIVMLPVAVLTVLAALTMVAVG